MAYDDTLTLPETHPAELDHLTYAELSKLLANLGRLRRELAFVTQDITRITEYGKTIVYLLDFSELHSLLWEQSTSQYRHVVSYLLQETSLVFALPPGAIQELVFHLEVSVSKQSERRRSLQALFEKPMVKAFMRADQRAKSGTASISEALASDVLGALVDFRQESEALERLAKLYDQGRLRPLSTLIDVSDKTLDRDVFHDAYVQLSANRVGKADVVNFIDAHNYAFTYGLNNALYQDKDQLFLLVTSSVEPYEVFENIKWTEDPMFEHDPVNIVRTSLVRHPIQLLYHASLSQYGTQARRVITDATNTLLRLQQSWVEVPGYRGWSAKKDRPGSDRVQLPAEHSYTKLVQEFNETYQKLYRPLAEVLAGQVALEQNHRLLRGVSQNGVAGVYPYDEAQHTEGGRHSEWQFTPNYRQALALYDRIVKLASEQTQRDFKELRRFPKETVVDIDSKGKIFPIDEEDLSLSWHKNSDLRSMEITATSKNVPDQSYLWIDRYESFTSFYWQTNVDFAEFLKVARHYVKTVAAWIDVAGEEKEPSRGKIYNGIHFFLDKEVKRLPLEHLDDLSADLILAQCEPHWNLRYVRIGLPYGDLCYDFAPIGSLPQRAGLLTHLKCFNAIADFIQWTNVKFARRGIWRRVVAASMTKDFSA